MITGGANLNPTLTSNHFIVQLIRGRDDIIINDFLKSKVCSGQKHHIHTVESYNRIESNRMACLRVRSSYFLTTNPKRHLHAERASLAGMHAGNS
jgi:hypothetical protein